jgi:hypothetical protein
LTPGEIKVSRAARHAVGVIPGLWVVVKESGTKTADFLHLIEKMEYLNYK